MQCQWPFCGALPHRRRPEVPKRMAGPYIRVMRRHHPAFPALVSSTPRKPTSKPPDSVSLWAKTDLSKRLRSLSKRLRNWQLR